MAYATQQDLLDSGLTEAELGQIVDDDNLGKLDDAKIQTRIDAALADGASTIDSYCRLRYKVPLQSSQKVTSLCVDLALFALFSRRRRVPDAVKDRANAALAFLKDIAAGKAGLDQPTNATPQSGGGEAVETTQEQRFSDDNLEGFA